LALLCRLLGFDPRFWVPPVFFKASEGLAPSFQSRTLGPDFRPTFGGRGAGLSAEGESRRPRGKDPEEPRIKDSPIDPMSGKN
jgi:hypothetical protein